MQKINIFCLAIVYIFKVLRRQAEHTNLEGGEKEKDMKKQNVDESQTESVLNLAVKHAQLAFNYLPMLWKVFLSLKKCFQAANALVQK